MELVAHLLRFPDWQVPQRVPCFLPFEFRHSRAKSMGAAQRMAAPKRSKVSDRVSVIVDDLEEEDDQASLDLWTWCEKFQLVVNSWELAGSFTV